MARRPREPTIALMQLIESAATEWNRSDLLRALIEGGVPAGPVNDLKAVFEDPQVRHRELAHAIHHPLSDGVRVVRSPIRLSKSPACHEGSPPLLGEHSDWVLQGVLGKSKAEIEDLRKRGVI